MASFVVSFAMIATSLAAGWAGLISLDASATGLRCAVRVVSLSMAFISAVALGGIGPYRPAAIAGWTACLLVTVASGSRIATLSILAILAMHPGIGRLRWRLAAVVAFVGLGVALFYLPVFQNRFFYSGSGTLADVWEGKFDDAGRFYAWRAILPEIGRRPWIGSGVGSIHDYVPTVWPESVHIHNDYLRIAYEFGIVGLALFLAVVAWQILDLWRHTRSPAPAIRWASLSAVLGIAAFLITALTDNTLMYNLWFTNPLFTMIGAVYGLAAVESGAATAAAPIAAGSEQ